MKSHINITLLLKKEKFDLRIPIELRVKDLLKELYDIFGDELLNKECNLKVINKDFIILNNEYLKDYPLSNGDLIEII